MLRFRVRQPVPSAALMSQSAAQRMASSAWAGIRAEAPGASFSIRASGSGRAQVMKSRSRARVIAT